MQPGDRISAFIRQLTRADFVVAVISDKYLRSPYCMYEIYKLRERGRGARGTPTTWHGAWCRSCCRR